ncbi:MAG TPA: FAD synthetase family protein [Bacteroidales bacterium]|nr:FAD synthetase family protein [Bacteroidales bacterium]
MRIFRNFEDARCIRNPVVTTGSFDGVHVGHKTILNRLRMLAEKYEGESVLITFDPHPRKVLYPDTLGKELRLINSREEKLFMLEKAGLQNVIIIEFTREFSKTTSEEFVREYLHGILKAKVIVVGFNHHFGFNKEGDYKHLWTWRERYNFEAEEIPEQEVYHETVSSTRIRKAISEGYIQRANAYLDSYYLIKGLIVPCVQQYSFQSGWMSINITDENKLLPASGIYATSIEDNNNTVKCMAVVCRIEGAATEIMIDILEPCSVSAGNDITLYFHKKIHGALNLSDSNAIVRIKNAKSEISELIY